MSNLFKSSTIRKFLLNKRGLALKTLVELIIVMVVIIFLTATISGCVNQYSKGTKQRDYAVLLDQMFTTSADQKIKHALFSLEEDLVLGFSPFARVLETETAIIARPAACGATLIEEAYQNSDNKNPKTCVCLCQEPSASGKEYICRQITCSILELLVPDQGAVKGGFILQGSLKGPLPMQAQIDTLSLTIESFVSPGYPSLVDVCTAERCISEEEKTRYLLLHQRSIDTFVRKIREVKGPALQTYWYEELIRNHKDTAQVHKALGATVFDIVAAYFVLGEEKKAAEIFIPLPPSEIPKEQLSTIASALYRNYDFTGENRDLVLSLVNRYLELFAQDDKDTHFFRLAKARLVFDGLSTRDLPSLISVLKIEFERDAYDLLKTEVSNPAIADSTITLSGGLEVLTFPHILATQIYSPNRQFILRENVVRDIKQLGELSHLQSSLDVLLPGIEQTRKLPFTSKEYATLTELEQFVKEKSVVQN